MSIEVHQEAKFLLIRFFRIKGTGERNKVDLKGWEKEGVP